MSKLKKIKFKEFIKLQRGFDLPKKDMIDGPYPVIGSTSIIGYHNEYKVNPPGVITGRSGSLGKLQYIDVKYWPHNTALWTKEFKGNYPRYVYYFLHTIDFENFNAGAGVPTLNRNHLDNYDISIHEGLDQRKVATIPSNYDDLIENNTKRIQLLEKMAKLIYDEWFVKFKFPGHEKVKFVDSELGKIPEGWKIKKLEEYVDFVRGIEPGSKNYLEKPDGKTIQFLRVGDLGKRDSEIFIDKELANDKILNKRNIVISLDGTVGIVRIGLEGAYSTGIRKVVLKENKYLPWSFIYFLLKYSNIQNTIKAHARGTTILHASSAINYMNFILPPKNIFEKFESLCDHIINKILILSNKNQNLQKTRDLLLPKLISGQVEVSDLDIKVPEVEA